MPMTSISLRRNELAAVEITALAAGAGPPANKMATRRKLVWVLGGRDKVIGRCSQSNKYLRGLAGGLPTSAACPTGGHSTLERYIVLNRCVPRKWCRCVLRRTRRAPGSRGAAEPWFECPR